MSVHQISFTNVSTGKWGFGGQANLPVGCSATVVQAELEAIYGAGNLVVCSMIGTRKTSQVVINGIYNVIFIGKLWNKYVPMIPVANGTNGQIKVMVRPISHRIYALFQHTCDIHVPQSNRTVGVGDIEVADIALSYVASYSNIPCYYEGTPNFEESKMLGRNKEANIFTSDKWHFLVEQDLLSGYMIKMTTVEHRLYGELWTVQGNPTINDYNNRRQSEGQWCYSVLAPNNQLSI